MPTKAGSVCLQIISKGDFPRYVLILLMPPYIQLGANYTISDQPAHIHKAFRVSKVFLKIIEITTVKIAKTQENSLIHKFDKQIWQYDTVSCI